MLFLYIWLPREVALKLSRIFGAETFLEIIIELYSSRCLYVRKFFPVFFAQERTLNMSTFLNFGNFYSAFKFSNLRLLSDFCSCIMFYVFKQDRPFYSSTSTLSCIFYQVCDCAALNLKFEINNLTITITSSFDVWIKLFYRTFFIELLVLLIHQETVQVYLSVICILSPVNLKNEMWVIPWKGLTVFLVSKHVIISLS